MKTILSVIVALIIAGCATTVSSPEQVSENTTISYDPYLSSYTINGMRLDIGGFPNITKIWLRGGFHNSGKNEFIQLYVYHWSQTGWNFFHSASDINGKHLGLRKLGSDVEMGGNVVEQVAVDMSLKYLISKKEEGLNIRLLGSKGSQIITVPAIYVAGFIQKYNQLKSEALTKDAK